VFKGIVFVNQKKENYFENTSQIYAKIKTIQFLI